MTYFRKNISIFGNIHQYYRCPTFRWENKLTTPTNWKEEECWVMMTSSWSQTRPLTRIGSFECLRQLWIDCGCGFRSDSLQLVLKRKKDIPNKEILLKKEETNNFFQFTYLEISLLGVVDYSKNLSTVLRDSSPSQQRIRNCYGFSKMNYDFLKRKLKRHFFLRLRREIEEEEEE